MALNSEQAYRYAMKYAESDHDDLTRFHREGKAFFGTLGALDFQFQPEEGMLHVWVFIMPGAKSTEQNGGAHIKQILDRIAKERPSETSGGVFDIRTLAWNRQATPKLEPCLYLRLDITDGSLSPDDIFLKLKEFSKTGYIWHRNKISEVLSAYRHHSYRDE